MAPGQCRMSISEPPPLRGVAVAHRWRVHAWEVRLRSLNSSQRVLQVGCQGLAIGP